MLELNSFASQGNMWHLRKKLLFVCGGPAGNVYRTSFWTQIFRLFSVGGLLLNKHFILHKAAQVTIRTDLDLPR